MKEKCKMGALDVEKARQECEEYQETSGNCNQNMRYKLKAEGEIKEK